MLRTIDHTDLVATRNNHVGLSTFDPALTADFKDKDDAQEKLCQDVTQLAKLQDVFFADRRYALLNIFQGMDTAGKDGAIRHVMAGISPQGVDETVRVYYPPDSNCLLSVFDHCKRSRNYVNIVTCGKEPQLQWLTMEEALEHCSQGASTWRFATNDGGGEPDVVLACAGDVPTIEICAASWLLQKYVPGIKVRVVNVVDLMTLTSPDDHPHGMDNMSFNALFTTHAPVVFAFHNNRWLIHTMVHGRSNEARFHVRGYMDRGTTTTPFDMVVLNEMSRFHLALDALAQVPRLRTQAAKAVDLFNAKLYEHHSYIREHLEDMPEIRNWRWTPDFSEPGAPPPLAKGHPRPALFSDS